MSRNGSGTFSVINTMVAGTTITAAAHNENYGDIGDEITNSVAADGQTSMSGALKHAAGTAATPSITFAADTNTGIYRVGENILGFAVDGTTVLTIGTATAVFAGVVTGSSVPFPTGTAMLFAQTAAPTGWTKSTTHNDKALRIVSGTASTGGSVAFSTVFGRTATDSFTILQGHLPNYVLPSTLAATPSLTADANSTGITASGTLAGSTTGETAGANNTAYITGGGTNAVTVTISDPTHGHTVSGSVAITGSVTLGGSGASFTMPIDTRVQYVDVIIATKA